MNARRSSVARTVTPSMQGSAKTLGVPMVQVDAGMDGHCAAPQRTKTTRAGQGLVRAAFYSMLVQADPPVTLSLYLSPVRGGRADCSD